MEWDTRFERWTLIGRVIMEFTVSYASFASAVSDINKIISSKSVIPILSGIKIEANESGLSLTGSNSDIFIERTIPLLMMEKR